MAPLDVRLARGRIVQPDAFVILAGLALDASGPIERVPDLCIEVLSHQRSYDRLTKRLLYAEAGVRELWTVDPLAVVERWTGAGLSRGEAVAGRVTSELLPDFSLELTDLFRRD